MARTMALDSTAQGQAQLRVQVYGTGEQTGLADPQSALRAAGDAQHGGRLPDRPIREADKHVADLRAARRELPTSATSERMAADLLRSALRDGAEWSWISQQLTRLLPPGDHEAAKIAENVLGKVFTNPLGGMRRGPEPPRLGGMNI